MDEEEVDPAYDPTLVRARQDFVRQLTIDQIVGIEVVEEYTDDHLPCVDVHITFQSGDVLSCAFLYTSLTGAFQYWEDSKKARQDIVDCIKAIAAGLAINSYGGVLYSYNFI